MKSEENLVKNTPKKTCEMEDKKHLEEINTSNTPETRTKPDISSLPIHSGYVSKSVHLDQSEYCESNVSKENKSKPTSTIDAIDKNTFDVSFLFIFKSAVQYFTCNGHKPLKIIGLFVCIVLKNVSNCLSMLSLNNLDGKLPNLQRKAIINSAFCLGITYTLNFLVDWVFEKWNSKYGGTMLMYCIEKIMNASDVRINDIDTIKTAYNTVQGSNALAKVNKNLLCDVPSKLVHLICDATLIFYADKTEYKILFSGFFIGVSVITMVKTWTIYSSMKHVRKMSKAAAERDKTVEEILDKAVDIKGYNADAHFLHKLKKSCRVWIKNRRRFKLCLGLGDFIQKVLTLAFQVSICWIFLNCDTGNFPVKLALLLKILLDTVKTMEKSSDLFKNMSEAVAEAEIVLNYLYIKQENTSQKYHTDQFNDKLVFDNVTYSVQNGNRIIFDKINFILKAGEKAVLFGPNGTGKSSLFKILTNQVLYSGQVTLDDVDVKQIARRSLTKLFTFVPQNTLLVEGSIFYNIKFANNEISHENIINICKELDIHDSIMKYPEGYNTQVGGDGRNINGGLRQKIFYARAILRNTPIYLFDEPGNNLDEQHSNQFMDYVFETERLRNKTVFVICHDTEQINRFPNKYKFSDGQIVQV